MVGISDPSKDSQDTYPASEIRNRGQQIEEIRAGEPVTLTKKLDILRPVPSVDPGNPDQDVDPGKPWAQPFSVTRSSKWFTISDCAINESGEITYTLATTAGEKTPSERVVKVEQVYQQSSGMVHYTHRQYWYRIV